MAEIEIQDNVARLLPKDAKPEPPPGSPAATDEPTPSTYWSEAKAARMLIAATRAIEPAFGKEVRAQDWELDLAAPFMARALNDFVPSPGGAVPASPMVNLACLLLVLLVMVAIRLPLILAVVKGQDRREPAVRREPDEPPSPDRRVPDEPPPPPAGGGVEERDRARLFGPQLVG